MQGLLMFSHQSPIKLTVRHVLCKYGPMFDYPWSNEPKAKTVCLVQYITGKKWPVVYSIIYSK